MRKELLEAEEYLFHIRQEMDVLENRKTILYNQAQKELDRLRKFMSEQGFDLDDDMNPDVAKFDDLLYLFLE